jgi:hypothetical protein
LVKRAGRLYDVWQNANAGARGWHFAAPFDAINRDFVGFRMWRGVCSG